MGQNGCNCTDSQNNSTTLSGNSSQITWNGAPLCFGINTGDNLNTLLEVFSGLFCRLREQLASSNFTGTRVTVTVGANTISVPTTTNAQVAIAQIVLILNQLYIDFNALETDDVHQSAAFVKGDVTSIGTGDHLTVMLNKIIAYYDAQLLLTVAYPDFYQNGQLGAWYIPFSESLITVTDTSGGGTASVTIGANVLFTDGQRSNMPSTDIDLVDNADNYIYLAQGTTFAYAVSSVGIGGAAPTTTGVHIAKVTTGTGTVAGYSVLIAEYPIDATLIKDGSITKMKLGADVVGDGMKIVANQIVPRLETVNPTLKVTATETGVKYGNGLTQDATGLIAKLLSTGNLEFSGSSIAVKLYAAIGSILGGANGLYLNGDVLNPGADFYYATDSGGTKTWRKSEVRTAEITVTAATMNAGTGTSPSGQGAAIDVNIPLLAGQGANTIIVVKNITVYLKSNAAAYVIAAGDKFVARYSTSSGATDLINLLTEAELEANANVMKNVATLPQNCYFVNKGINLGITSSAGGAGTQPTTGDMTITVKIWYSLQTII